MKQWIEKALSSPTIQIGILGFFVAAMIFLIRLDVDASHLQDDVANLQKSVSEVQIGVGEVKSGQQRILDSLENIEVALGNHVHEADGTVRVTLPSH